MNVSQLLFNHVNQFAYKTGSAPKNIYLGGYEWDQLQKFIASESFKSPVNNEKFPDGCVGKLEGIFIFLIDATSHVSVGG